MCPTLQNPLTRRRILSLLGGVAVIGAVPAQAADNMAWTALGKGEAFAIIRHALAPGTSDPDNFDIDDCATQRNLSDEGRAQAARLGGMFRDNGIVEADVYTSAWCRCRETAELMDIGTPEALPAINSFFRSMQREAEQTRALKEYVETRQSDRPLVLVTHQVNITALTGIFPQSGEIIFVAKDDPVTGRVLDRIVAPL